MKWAYFRAKLLTKILLIFSTNHSHQDERFCTDLPEFADKHGQDCKNARLFGKCEDGTPANGYTEESLIGEANAQGVSILSACCQCGGGLDGK